MSALHDPREHDGEACSCEDCAIDECEQLKATHGIVTQCVNEGYWKAWNLDGFACAFTELAAVTKLIKQQEKT